MAFIRYMLLFVAKRDDEDGRTLSDMFYLMAEKVVDITYNMSLQIIVEDMMVTLQAIFKLRPSR